ncbi:hypothetical protein MED217_09882 [Leeuwenhoekiella blandensis MED217]|jgi:hypothetical protein|uniref:Uncharacterized protein n=1 Tax=Leeuwenhoekiella blandensis (strain CECT 7118 / CCUG 51940 / KCTC 22103 / MED217) TaxID=398720 RepID=A3XNL8_LEEBM|nr:hypothetical protein MED217_09882 [Leeuwenhoekiella blandensis MED217]|tara:strand:+ start:3753 stop:3878 length:126 start_codon:yes stop_codon:yes gene_type:complete
MKPFGGANKVGISSTGLRSLNCIFTVLNFIKETAQEQHLFL